jgi:iron(III) transport system permease protein
MKLKSNILIFFFFISMFLVIGLLPIVVMFIKSLFIDGKLTLAYYYSLFSSPHSWLLFFNSLKLSFSTTLFSLLAGIPLGILCGKTDLPGRRLFAVLFAIPLLVPPYIMAVAWFNIFGRAGFFAQLASAAIAEHTSLWLFGLPGCVLVLSSVFMPIVMVLTMTYLKSVNPHLEEAARLAARWPYIIAKIALPLILPGIFLSAVLVFILSLGELTVPMFLRYDVFPVQTLVQFSAFYNFSFGTAAALVLVIFVAVILMIEAFLSRQQYQVLSITSEEPLAIGLGSYRWPLFALISLFSAIFILAPLLTLVLKAGGITNYAKALSASGDSLIRSLHFAFWGACCLSIFGFLFGYIICHRLFLWRQLDFLTIFLLTLPSTVIGVGLIVLWNNKVTNFIYATPIIIVLGYIAQYTAITSRITLASMGQIPSSMEEAGQIVGAGWLRRMAFLVLPLARRGLMAGWLVAYIFCIRDTGISMMVYPPGRDPLTVRSFTLMANNPMELISALCVIMVLAVLIPLGVASKLLSGITE